MPSLLPIGARHASILVVVGLVAGCALLERPVPFRTVTGPESPLTVAGLSGRFAIDEGVASFCYPVRPIDPSGRARCITHFDDAAGWLAAIVPDEDRFVLRMRMTHASGPSADAVRQPDDVALETATYCRAGTDGCTTHGRTIATWTRQPGINRYHQTLAVSPDGRRAAIVPEAETVRGPGFTGRSRSGVRFRATRKAGPLKIVDLRSGAIHDVGIDVVDEEPVSWSHDGRTLLVVRMEPVERLPARLAASGVDDVGQAGQGVPAIESVDLETRETTMLAIGQQPLWSPDERTLLFQPADERVATMDLVDLVVRPAELPGMSTRYEPIAIAFVAPRRVLYWALPTAGVDPAFTVNNSPLVGPKQMLSLKVADLDTGAFATVYPRLDPRARVGFSTR